jgi:hypothetical protein
MIMTPLRSCSAGGGHHLGYVSRSLGGKYFCPRHLRDLFEGFDPQAGDSVRSIDPLGVGPMAAFEALAPGPGGRYEADYVVVGRDGEKVTLRFLGFPEEPHVTASVHQLYPGAGAHVQWSHGCGK